MKFSADNNYSSGLNNFSLSLPHLSHHFSYFVFFFLELVHPRWFALLFFLPSKCNPLPWVLYWTQCFIIEWSIATHIIIRYLMQWMKNKIVHTKNSHKYPFNLITEIRIMWKKLFPSKSSRNQYISPPKPKWLTGCTKVGEIKYFWFMVMLEIITSSKGSFY